MKPNLFDANLLQQIEPTKLAAYLRKAGWTERAAYGPNATIWTRWNASWEAEGEILLPLDKELGDYVLRLTEALGELARFEGRTLYEVVLDIKGRGFFKSGSMRDWRDSLIGFWGLDIFGLSGIKKGVVAELASIAVLLTALLVFDLAVWTVLFLMLVDDKFLPLALVLGIVFSTSLESLTGKALCS